VSILFGQALADPDRVVHPARAGGKVADEFEDALLDARHWGHALGRLLLRREPIDCDVEAMQYVQVFLHDGNGNIPDGAEVFYFSESGGTSLPTDKDSQPHTNTNGLWVAINIPAGTWTVEAWGYDTAAATHVKLGTTVLQIAAGCVNLSNIYTGISGGIWYPGSCLAACGG